MIISFETCKIDYWLLYNSLKMKNQIITLNRLLLKLEKDNNIKVKKNVTNII